MFSMTVPWWEIVARAAFIYLALFALIRMTGKREVGELTPFDLVFLLVISEFLPDLHLIRKDFSLSETGMEKF